MKKMNIKKLLVSTLAVATLGVCAGGIAVASNDYVTASAETIIPTPATFEMRAGASVRTTADAGIRFSTYISKAWIDGLKAEHSVEVGTLVIPQRMLTDTNENGTLDNADFHRGTSGVLDIVHEDEGKWIDCGEYWKVNAVVYGIPADELATTLAAKSYVSIDYLLEDGVTVDPSDETLINGYYAENPQVRSIGSVASKALAAGETGSFLEQTVAGIFEEVAFTVDGDAVSGEYALYKNSTAEIALTGVAKECLAETPIMADYTFALASDNEEAATVTDGVLSYVEGTANITAKIGSVAFGSFAVKADTIGDSKISVGGVDYDVEANFWSDAADPFVSSVVGNACTFAGPVSSFAGTANRNSVLHIQGDADANWGSNKNGRSLTLALKDKLDKIFAEYDSFSFDVYHDTNTAKIMMVKHTSQNNATNGIDNGTIKSKTVSQGQWKKVTITKEQWESTYTSGTKKYYFVMQFALDENKASTKPTEDFNLYLDNFKVGSRLAS